jgi:hypothetical protein
MLQKIRIIEGVSFIEGVKHKYKKYVNILSCVEISLFQNLMIVMMIVMMMIMMMINTRNT